jgi:N-acetylmuramoyl-L-alanine amidase
MLPAVGKGRRWWLAALGACLALEATRGDAAELRRLEVTPAAEGATAVVLLSAPVRATVRDVTAPDGTPARVYVDLPRGTRLGRGALRAVPASAPVGRARVGVGEHGQVRVVLDLESPATYRVRGDGRRLLLTFARVAETKPPAAPSPTARGPMFPSRTKIVLDPGHGGHDPGAQGYAVEKDVTLAIAKRVAALLAEKLGAEVVLTRSADSTLPLAERTARANAEGADLFVSIHANASLHPRLHGVETYYLNNTHDRGTIRLAAMENGLRLPMPARGGTDLRYIVSDLVQAGKMEESIALATAVQRALVDHLGARWGGVADLGVKRGPFYVLVGAYMPCVLVETSFLTHPIEGRRLAARAYRDAVAEGIYTGIARFLADARRAHTL